ncbi:MAG: hypothetical protein ACK5KT_05035 [Dysgonomonas sp.]
MIITVMNPKYIYTLLLVVVIFTSCGGDDNSGGLRYVETSSGYESYVLYVGSESGGVEVHADSIKGRIDKIFPATVFENYTNTTISFINNHIIIEQSGSAPEKSIYKFEDNSLYIYKAEVPVYFGDGNHDALDIRQHYIAYKQPGDEVFNNISALPQKNIDKDNAAAESPFVTITNMKSEGDTLIWCTRKSAFR